MIYSKYLLENSRRQVFLLEASAFGLSIQLKKQTHLITSGKCEYSFFVPKKHPS